MFNEYCKGQNLHVLMRREGVTEALQDMAESFRSHFSDNSKLGTLASDIASSLQNPGSKPMKTGWQLSGPVIELLEGRFPQLVNKLHK